MGNVKFTNEVRLCGNMTRDPETRQAGNSTVTKASIAINRKVDRGGEKSEEVTFVEVEAWNALGEKLTQYKKGQGVTVEGRLKMDTWQDKATGANRSKLYVVAFLVGPPIEWDNDGKKGAQQSGKAASPKPAPTTEHELDVPF